MDIVINTDKLKYIIGNDKLQCLNLPICFYYKPIDHFCDEVTISTARAYRLKVALILTYYHIYMIITSCCPLKNYKRVYRRQTPAFI